jgi:class 3 adenylate cyclase
MSSASATVDTRSVLFTDLVASTELRVQHGDEIAEETRRAHDGLVETAVVAHDGTVVKGLGDGLMATFPSAADAVAAAVAIQQGVELHSRRDPDQAFALRVGVSIGDVTLEADDVFGVPVVEASRLCGAAAGGEILAADVVRALARGRGGYVFEPMGSLELKGLAEPLGACRIVWEPLAEAAGGERPSELPGALVGWVSTEYVGRVALLDELRADWDSVAGGGCRTVLLAGEPGIGKTRTATELARHAHAEGALVLYGRCEEGLGVPYQPFVEALDWYTTHASTPVLGRLPGELTRLAPDLAIRMPRLPAPVASDPRSEEHRLFEAVASWLLEASTTSGLVLVLDDLHWAAKPTLLMLLHALRAAADAGNNARLLVLATYRDTDIDRSHPLSGVLADLRRLPNVKRVAVDSLTPDEVVSLVAAAAGVEIDDDGLRLATLIHEETEGNPFFVGEVLRHLVETGAVRRGGERWVVTNIQEIAVPEGVRDVVGRRLSELSTEANDTLASAAVIGRSISLDVLAAVSPNTEDEILDALDEAVRARLLEETGPEEYRFAHALVRSTLYDELSVTRKRRAHRRVADALEKLHPDDVAVLAYHSVEAGPDGGDLTRAVGYVLAAADRAQGSRALAEAEAQFRLALELLADSELPDPVQELRARCGLGECQRDQGDAGYRTTLLDAAGFAKAEGQVDLLVRAVLSNSRGITSIVGAVDEERVALTEAALAAIPPGPSADRARLLAHLADEVVFAGDDDRRLALADEAEGLARELGDRNLLASVLVSTEFASITGDRWRQVAEHTAEAAELADETGDPALRAIAWTWRSGSLLTLGDIAGVEAATQKALACADEGSPSVRWMTRSSAIKVLALRGRVEELQQRNDEARAIGDAAGEPDAPMWWAANAIAVVRLRGEVGDVVDTAAALADEYPKNRGWRTTHAWALAEAGRLDEARDIVARYQLDPASRDTMPFNGPAVLGRIARLCGDLDLARRTLEVLAPHWQVWSHYHLGSMGPVSNAMGLCEATLGNDDEAIALLEAGDGVMTAQGCEPDPHDRLELAGLLQSRNQPGDRARADALLADVRAFATRIDAPRLLARADAIATSSP